MTRTRGTWGATVDIALAQGCHSDAGGVLGAAGYFGTTQTGSGPLGRCSTISHLRVTGEYVIMVLRA